jgi:HEAT repeat protein
MKTANTDNSTMSESQRLPALEPELSDGSADFREVAPITTKPRYIKETQILARAIAGDLRAAGLVLRYLDSPHPDLRRIMQETMHDTIDPRLWRILLSYLGMGDWVDYQRLSSAQVVEERAVRLQGKSSGALQLSIAEAFVLDESETENLIKQKVLSDALNIRYLPMRRIRHASAWISGLRGEVKVVSILEEIIDELDRSEDNLWISRAVEALAAINDERCGHALIKVLAQGRGELHQQARRALGDMGHNAEKSWIAALTHHDSHVRWHAARALGQLGDIRGVDELAKGLYDESHSVRWATASVLANLDAAAIPAILKVLVEHPLNEQFRQAVYHALHAMPAHKTKEYLLPLLEALRRASADMEAPVVAQRLLLDWRLS